MNQQQQQQQQPPLMQLNNHNLMNVNKMTLSQPPMLPVRVGYGVWPQPSHFGSPLPSTGVMNPQPPAPSLNGRRSNWKGKNIAGSNKNDKRRKEPQIAPAVAQGNFSYQPPGLNELQHRNQLKTRKFFPRKRFNRNLAAEMGSHSNEFYHNSSRSAPYAPRNTTSFIIRAKKSGGIASLVSPSPGTPAILPTPILSPSREVLVDMAKEEWGVDGYGSMKGLIRLRSPGYENEDEEDEGGFSEVDVEEHVELDRRLDHDLNRFEMIYNPKSSNLFGMEYQNVLENRVDDQDSHIAQLEEENLILKERLFLMESELGDLRSRMQFLEQKQNDPQNEEVMENASENESESHEEDHGSTGKDDENQNKKGFWDDTHEANDETEFTSGAELSKSDEHCDLDKQESSE